MGTLWNALVQFLTDALIFFNHIVGSYGLAIILFTLVVKLITLPLTMKQVRSSKAMQELQPQLKALQEKYKNDKERQTQEMMQLYKEYGVNPASGCLPLLIQMPIWFALYRALFALAREGHLNEGWLWIPSLAEPRSITMFWPPANWTLTTIAYLILPVLTVVTQLVVQKQMSPPTTASKDDPSSAMLGQMNTIMPLMFGFFALQVPSGLTLYWVTSNLFAMFQQVLITGEINLPRWLGGATFRMPGSQEAGNPPPVIETKKGRPASPNGSDGAPVAKDETEIVSATETKDKSNVTTKSRKRKKRRSQR
ncbi:MAG: YidC/Oxa1 family membrane protein insertase [Ardenticatenaceae bacterium]|nr:YidC/Oxa1 family membrane protein insertase [Ardenticatenaceae bacterium]